METKGQFQLLSSRRFLPLFLTQFFGALNDNLFKNALLVIIVSASFVSAGTKDTNTLVNLAAGLFVLPFLLFSAISGQLIDKYEKSKIIRGVKIFEILIMVIGFIALWLQLLWLLFVVLFFMGVQSTFFGPAKYAIIPQHLHPEELVAGNAQVSMGTFVAILLGTIAGSLMGGADNAVWLVGTAVVLVASIGWLSSRKIPLAESKITDLKIDWNILRISWKLVQLSREKKSVFLAILGISWFWMLGASYLTQMPNFTQTVLHGNPGVIALILCAFTIGVACGSLFCDRLSGHHIEVGLVPLGSLGLSLFGIDLYFSANSYAGVGGFSTLGFFAQPGSIRVLLDIAMIGLSGGLYIVPLYAMVQARTEESKRARVIACNNILNALFMVASSLMGIVLLGVAGISIPELFLIVALMNIAVAVFIFFQVPEFTMRFIVWLLSHSIYRVKHQGLEHIPAKGGAIIVCNHVSYVDALLLAGAVHRPIRFIIFKPIYEIPILNFIFRTGGAIPICSRTHDEQGYDRAMDDIAQGLEQGDLLCIFPEGQLTLDGKINDFRPGIERILSRTPVPVVPMALQGLWGSFFSHSHGGAFKKPFRPQWRNVRILAEKPLFPEEVNAIKLQQKVASMRGSNQ